MPVGGFVLGSVAPLAGSTKAGGLAATGPAPAGFAAGFALGRTAADDLPTEVTGPSVRLTLAE